MLIITQCFVKTTSCTVDLSDHVKYLIANKYALLLLKYALLLLLKCLIANKYAYINTRVSHVIYTIQITKLIY